MASGERGERAIRPNSVVAGSSLEMEGPAQTDFEPVTFGQLKESWTALPFETGWVTYDAAYVTPGYRKVGDTVQVRGVVKRTSGSSVVIATLPAGYRPPGRLVFTTRTEDGAGTEDIGRIDVKTSGDIEVIIGQMALVPLNMIFFGV